MTYGATGGSAGIHLKFGGVSTMPTPPVNMIFPSGANTCALRFIITRTSPSKISVRHEAVYTGGASSGSLGGSILYNYNVNVPSMDTTSVNNILIAVQTINSTVTLRNLLVLKYKI